MKIILMKKEKKASIPLVYSCSGSSNLAQITNQVSVELSRDGFAEMSCIAGVGGGVPSLVRKAKSGRYIIALDGCSLQCVKTCLSKQDVLPSKHYILTKFGLRKKLNCECEYDSKDVHLIKKKIESDYEEA